MHVAVHTPALQLGDPFEGAEQTLLQAPQLLGSVWRLTQELLQFARPELHVKPHTPEVQVADPFAGAEQTLLQPPQLLVSPARSTQELLQFARPELHVKPHTPEVQVADPFAGAGQTLLQAPQWLGSVDVLKHWPEQQVPEQQTTFRPVVPHIMATFGHCAQTASHRRRCFPEGNWLQKALQLVRVSARTRGTTARGARMPVPTMPPRRQSACRRGIPCATDFASSSNECFMVLCSV